MKLLPQFSKTSQVIYKSILLRARPAVKINVNEVELTIFKGTNSVLASDIVKVVIRYAR